MHLEFTVHVLSGKHIMPLCNLTYNLVLMYVTFVSVLAFNIFSFLVSYEQVQDRDGRTYDHGMLLNATS